MYTEAQLNALLAQVEAEFAPFLAKSEADVLLAKAEDEGDKKPKSEDKPKDAAPPAPKEGEGKPEGESKDAPPAAAKEDAPPAEGAPPGAPADGVAPPADPAACPPGDPNCDYDEEDHAHMAEMYGSMSPGELKAHHDAIRQCLDAQGGMQAAAAPAAAPPAPPADAGAPPAPPAAPMDKCGEMMKSEKDGIVVPKEAMVPATALELAKSELVARSNELEELKKSSEVMKAFITKLFEKKKAPAGKAITDLGVLEKSEGLSAEKAQTKGEITKILTAKTNNPTLAKSDRDAINAYYTGGQVNLDSIRHLLK